jgi:hypothetical protein
MKDFIEWSIMLIIWVIMEGIDIFVCMTSFYRGGYWVVLGILSIFTIIYVFWNIIYIIKRIWTLVKNK